MFKPVLYLGNAHISSQAHLIEEHANQLLENCDSLRRDLATCRSEAEALHTAVPLMSAFAMRQLGDFLATGGFASMKDLLQRYKKECKLRKQLYNELIELRGNIRVFCRVRPLSERESGQGKPISLIRIVKCLTLWHRRR